MTDKSKEKSNKKMSGPGDLVGSIDEGTSSARFMIFRAETAEVVCFHQMNISSRYPQEGWVEQDPMEMLDIVRECIDKALDKLIQLGGRVEVCNVTFVFFYLSRNILFRS